MRKCKAWTEDGIGAWYRCNITTIRLNPLKGYIDPETRRDVTIFYLFLFPVLQNSNQPVSKIHKKIKS